MSNASYLLNYGKSAEFGSFESILEQAWSRGDRVVIQSPRGLELGTILRIAPSAQAGIPNLPNSGSILRAPTSEDEAKHSHFHSRSQELFADGRSLVQSLDLPMELVDTEILLDGRQAYLHYLSRSEFDARGLIEQLSDRYTLLVRMHNLIQEIHEEGGCSSCGSNSDSGGCGRCSSGNCSTCKLGDNHRSAPVEGAQPSHRVSLA
jgi:cell fate regulator YaaT (PSP1 superfamily)